MRIEEKFNIRRLISQRKKKREKNDTCLHERKTVEQNKTDIARHNFNDMKNFIIDPIKCIR